MPPSIDEARLHRASLHVRTIFANDTLWARDTWGTSATGEAVEYRLSAAGLPFALDPAPSAECCMCFGTAMVAGLKDNARALPERALPIEPEALDALSRIALEAIAATAPAESPWRNCAGLVDRDRGRHHWEDRFAEVVRWNDSEETSLEWVRAVAAGMVARTEPASAETA